MNKYLKRALLPGLVATSLVSVNVISVKPAAANDNTIRDLGVGVGIGVLTGTITHHGSTFSNAVNGAAAAGATHVVRRNSHQKNNLLRDTAVGAAAGTVTGAFTNRHHTLTNAVNGAATGAVIDLLGR